MNKEKLSRRDFLKVSAHSIVAAGLPSYTGERKEEEGPLTDLPVLYTKDTPIVIETLSRNGWSLDYTKPGYEAYAPTWIKVSGMPFDISKIRPEPGLEVPEDMNPLGPIPWVADIPHVTGLQPTLLKAVVGYSDYNFLPRYFSGNIRRKEVQDMISTYAFTDHMRIYPSKIYNILTALYSIAEWQIQNGPMQPGETYSYLVMTGAAQRNKEKYLVGGYLDAGGICASVSTMSKTNFLASSQGYTTELMRFLHKPSIQYAENQFDPAITKENSDATVAFVIGRPDDYKWNSDFKFKLAEDSPPMYFSFAAHLKLDDEPLDPKHPARHRIQPADARLTFTISLVKERPDYEKQMEELLNLRENYSSFHNFDDGFFGGFTQKP